MGRSVSEGASGAALVYSASLTTSGTWNKPADIQDSDDVELHLVAGGGGGISGSGFGGAGGDGGLLRCKGRDLPATVDYVIGAGGTTGAAGGNTSFGHLIVIGGKQGAAGGPIDNGTTDPGFTTWSKGGNGAGSATAGGNSVYGGGGGADTGTGGLSWAAGDGGTNAGDTAEIPGGGGGRNRPGKRGQINITVYRG